MRLDIGLKWKPVISLLLLALTLMAEPSYSAPGDLDGPFSANGVIPNIVKYWATTVINSQDQGVADNILGLKDGALAIENPGGGFFTEPYVAK